MFTIDANKRIEFTTDVSSINGSQLPFSSDVGLLLIADKENWTKADVTAVWNKFAGAPPFEKLKRQTMFKNRPYGIQQIWKAIQVLKLAAAARDTFERGRKIASEGERASKSEVSPKPRRAPKTKGEKTPRTGTKREKVIELMSREGGVTLKALMEQMEWQPHTVRGFISTLQSKHGIKISSERHPEKGTIYRTA